MAINPISSGAFAPSSSPAALLSFFCSIVFRQPGERIYPFRLLVAPWRFSYTFIAASRPETADETVKLSRRISALPDFAASHIVGASIARPFAMALPVPTGRDTAKTESVQLKCAIKIRALAHTILIHYYLLLLHCGACAAPYSGSRS